MAFTQSSLNYATEYSKAMANAYPYWSYFSDLYGSPNSATYKPINGKSVAVQSMTVSGAKAVNRDQITGTFNRNFKQFFDLTLCNSANGGKACVYRLSRHLLYGKTTRI